MAKICYEPKSFNSEHRLVITRANQVIDAYAAQGYDLTLRQLYYQFVSRNWLANKDQSYKRLGTIVSDARRAGLIDWDRIVDRTRFIRRTPHWDGPEDIVASCAAQYDVDWWKDQKYRPEVWVEKDALIGVLQVACEPWRCPYFSCRGYTSDSELWSSAQRLKGIVENGQTPIIYHLGDHDPSGIDMSRDIFERLSLFAGSEIRVKRIALTMHQINEVNPPPNPAKTTDARYEKYRDEYGEESWELDALNPDYISNLIATEMKEIVSSKPWEESKKDQAEGRRLLGLVAGKWKKITAKL